MISVAHDEFKGLTCVSPEVLAEADMELTAHHYQHVGQKQPVTQQDGSGTGSSWRESRMQVMMGGW